MKKYIDFNGYKWTENDIIGLYADYLKEWYGRKIEEYQKTYEEFKENFLKNYKYFG